MLKSIKFMIFGLGFVLFSFVSCSNDDPLATEDLDKDNIATDNEENDSQTGDDSVIIDENETIDQKTVPDENEETDVDLSDEVLTELDDESVDEEVNDDESSNLNTGDTSGTQAATGKSGAPCTKDEDCTNWTGTDEQYAICLLPTEGYPGGYCSFMCDSSVALNYGCNGFGGVYYGYGTLGDGYCFHPCDDPTDCRVGYRCSQTVGACMPDCAVDACVLGTCDETEKVCLDK
ncbi:MAG TPA: hypothetical protein PL195_00515 [bacterium]|nr:hypothetical protein [bacterium]